MLHKRYIEMVTEIKANGCRFMFNSTGQLINDERARQLVELGVDKIMLSIDAVEPETYAYLHKGGTLDKVMNGIAALNREKELHGVTTPRLGWYFVACRSNLDQLVPAAKLAVRLGFGMMFVTHLNQPTGAQWRSYFDFYRQESLFQDAQLRQRYDDAVAEVRSITEAAGMEFFTGSADG
jgi:MoaA/NifB/PqqE/SkfB family radical SAM enzyme